MSDQQGGFLPFSSPQQSSDIAVAQNAPPSVTVPFVPKGKKVQDEDTITGGTQQWQSPTVPAYPVPFSGGEHVDTITGGTEAWKPPILPERQVGAGEAALEGVKSGMSLGFSPVLEGVANEGTELLTKNFGLPEVAARAFPPEIRTMLGTSKMFYDWATKGNNDPATFDAYKRGRDHAVNTQDLASSQQKLAYIGGLLAGSAIIPYGGEIGMATLPERLAAGVKQGATIGGAAGVGEGVSRGEDIPDIAKRGAYGTALGGAIGGAAGGILGPRAISGIPTSGQKAAITADELLHAPLGKGVASDRPVVRDTTAALQSVPFVGTRISSGVSKTQEAAGEHIAGIADTMTAGNKTRAIAGPIVKRGLEGVRQRNKQSANFAYDRVRAFLPQSGEVPISSYGLGTPGTDFVVNELAGKRFRSANDPFGGGLDQYRRLGGASFNGLVRARSEATSPSDFTRTNAGFDAAEHKRIADALDRDAEQALKVMGDAHGGNGNAAVAAWRAANTHFKSLVDENQAVDELLQAGGEKALERLIGAAKEKGGDYQLLLKLRQSMNKADWEQIGGHALGDMGRSGNDFSLQKFATAWEKMSDDAKVLLFDPNHLRNINDIVDMAQHIHKSLEKTNRSHTTGALIAIEALANLGHFVGEMMIGGASGTTMAATAGSAVTSGTAPFVVGWMLGNPARAASIRAYLAARSGQMVQPTLARTAVVNVASRNLANTLGIPLKQVQKVTEDTTPDQPQTAEQPSKQKASVK